MKYDIFNNVQNWIISSIPCIILAQSDLQNLPEISWLHGVLVGGMGIWAIWIGYEWLQSKLMKYEMELRNFLNEETQENK